VVLGRPRLANCSGTSLSVARCLESRLAPADRPVTAEPRTCALHPHSRGISHVHPPGPSDLLTDRAARAPTVGRGTRPVNHPQCSRRGNLRCPMGQDGAENTRRLRSTRPSDGACTQQKKCPRRRADLQDDQPQKLLRLGQGTRCGIPSISRRATTRQPGSRARSRTCRFRRGAAPGPACGRAAPDRRDATPPQRTRSNLGAVAGPSDVEKL
jgi:hypothetical protein